MNTKQSRPLIRWLTRLGLGGILLTLLLFAGSNLFLSSKPGQNFLQKNLNRRTYGITWQVSGASWSPWNGITVKELSANLSVSEGKKDTPSLPLLSLQQVALKPYWGQLIRGKKLFREVVLEQPEINIPVEYLVAFEPTAPPPAPAPKPTPTPNQKEKPQKPKPANKPQKQPKPAPSAPPKPKAPPKDIDEKRFWVRIRDAKIRLYSLKLNKALEIEKLNADLPLAGPATQGSLSWNKITFEGFTLSSQTKFPIDWKKPDWTLPKQDLALTLPQLADFELESIPLNVKLGGSFSPQRPAKNFRFYATLPPQPLNDFLLHKYSRFHLSSPSIAANLSSQGSLLNPNSWQFESAFAMSQADVYSELRGQHLVFESTRAQIGLRNATLLVPEFAIRSERLSILGNGQLHLGGYLLGVTRVVADLELADQIRGVAIGSHLIPWRSRWLIPLETPDRYYRDFHFEGFLPNAQVNTGPNGEFAPVSQVIELLRKFTGVEVAEEPSKSSENIPKTS